jgi:PAP2 superfamily
MRRPAFDPRDVRAQLLDCTRLVLGFGVLWILELACFIPYYTIMARRPGQVGAAAVARGQDLVALEQRLGVFVEPHLHGALRALGGSWVRWANQLYLWPHAVLLPAALLSVYLRRRRDAPRFVAIFTWSMLLSTLVFVAWPVAPPRLLPPFALAGGTFRFTDGVSPIVGHTVRFDDYASCPSFHMAFALLVFWAARRCWRGRAPALLAGAYVVSIALLVLATGNHYLVDLLAAWLVFALASGAAWGTLRVWSMLQVPNAAGRAGDSLMRPVRAAMPDRGDAPGSGAGSSSHREQRPRGAGTWQ